MTVGVLRVRLGVDNSGADDFVEAVDVVVFAPSVLPADSGFDVDAPADFVEDWPEAAVDDEPEDDELEGSAHAVPWPVSKTALTPRAAARPPIRPTCVALRTRQL